jgi:hypothetical protein
MIFTKFCRAILISRHVDTRSLQTIKGIFYECHKQFIKFHKQTTRKFNLQDCRFEFCALHYGIKLSFLLLNRISRKQGSASDVTTMSTSTSFWILRTHIHIRNKDYSWCLLLVDLSFLGLAICTDRMNRNCGSYHEGSLWRLVRLHDNAETPFDWSGLYKRKTSASTNGSH